MTKPMSVAFDAPPSPSIMALGRGCPIDLSAVQAAVGGDAARELQLLETFARKARLCLRRLGDGATGADLRKVATGLRNAALSVGAMRVVGAVELLEMKGNSADALSSVAATVLEAELFILKIAR